MGYYTDFSLSIKEGDKFVENQKLLDIINLELSNQFPKDETHLYASWRNHDKDMIELSKKYPDETFLLDGDGEESGDIWRTYYKNGVSYTDNVKMELPDFKESKLNKLLNQTKMKKTEVSADFNSALNSYVDAIKAVNPNAEFKVEFLNKYVRIISGTSVFCFVDKNTGDLLKAASFKIPAKGVRGNILTNFNHAPMKFEDFYIYKKK